MTDTYSDLVIFCGIDWHHWKAVNVYNLISTFSAEAHGSPLVHIAMAFVRQRSNTAELLLRQ
jgi:hypothetical protein